MMSLFTINYEKQALKKAKASLHDARRQLTESVQDKLYRDSCVVYSTNRVIYLEKVVKTLEGDADGKVDSIANIVVNTSRQYTGY